MSGQHVVRVLHFRSLLEHFLVEKFTLATLYHLKDFGGGLDSWSKIETSLASWKQWLIDVSFSISGNNLQSYNFVQRTEILVIINYSNYRMHAIYWRVNI